jgi:hypothetical protein
MRSLFVALSFVLFAAPAWAQPADEEPRPSTDVPVTAPPEVNLERFRQADGRMNWAEATRSGALRQVGGVTQFGLALFFKELALVAHSGDVRRMEEFFEFVASTDFLVHYGLFSLGAQVGQVANLNYLQGAFKPGSMARLLNTQLALAAGLGLTMVGNWDSRVYAINLASLGLSMSAVRGGVGALGWVHSATSRRGQSLLARVGVRGGKLTAGGFVYTVAETTVVLLVAEPVAKAISDQLDLRDARREVGKASEAFRLAVAAEDATPESVQAATATFQEAWGEYRRFLFREALLEEARFANKLKAVARDAKLASDRRAQSMERFERMPALTANVLERYGSLERYAEQATQEANDAVLAEVEQLAREFAERREARIREVYQAKRRGKPLLRTLKDPAAVFEAYPDDAAARRKDERRYRAAVVRPSVNRLETFSDEAEILRAASVALRRRELEDAARVVDEARRAIKRAAQADAELSSSQTLGAAGRLGGL